MASSGVAPPLKWHGGKHYLAKRVIELMPPHIHYVEPYFGGGAVLFAKDPEGVSEVVNDINAELTIFWAHLRDPFAFHDFRRRAEATPFAESVWLESCEVLGCFRSGGDVTVADVAWAFFVCCRQSLAGRMRSFTGVTKTRTRRGMNNEVSAWLSAVEGLPLVHERLKRVLIVNRDALHVMSGQDGPGTLFYLDPPYLDETRSAPDVYRHEMSREQHNLLLATLGIIEGKFILSGYRSSLYDDAASFHGWHREDIEVPNHAAGGSSKRVMTECLWMNFKPEEKS